MSSIDPGNLRIREYMPHDLSALHAMDGECFPAGIAFSRSDLLFFTRQKGSVTRIAELDDAMVGFAIGHLETSLRAHIITLDVSHEMRCRGIGAALMRALHEEFRCCGARTVILEVDVANSAARRFYEKLGYQYAEFLEGYYKGRSDALRMVMELEPGRGGSGGN